MTISTTAGPLRYRLYSALTLDLNEVATVWRATVAVYDPQVGADDYVALRSCPFNLAHEAAAQEWIGAQDAELRAQYGIPPEPRKPR